MTEATQGVPTPAEHRERPGGGCAKEVVVTGPFPRMASQRNMSRPDMALSAGPPPPCAVRVRSARMEPASALRRAKQSEMGAEGLRAAGEGGMDRGRALKLPTQDSPWARQGAKANFVSEKRVAVPTEDQQVPWSAILSRPSLHPNLAAPPPRPVSTTSSCEKGVSWARPTINYTVLT